MDLSQFAQAGAGRAFILGADDGNNWIVLSFSTCSRIWLSPRDT
jgi:hypothetical protein